MAVIGKHVMEKLILEVKDSKYYSISVDSTPDLCNVDQLTCTLRYVKDGLLVERFVEFIPIYSHTSENLASTVFDFLKKYDIRIEDCRGQSYDNASNMSGRYSGLQARFREYNKYADYVPCACHSLNLVGLKAAECCSSSVNFFFSCSSTIHFFVSIYTQMECST